MSGTISSLQKRVAKVKQEISDRKRRWELANCNCQKETWISSAEEFEALMNVPCLVHGFRRLGEIMRMDFGSNSRLTELLAIYEAGLAEVEQLKADETHES